MLLCANTRKPNTSPFPTQSPRRSQLTWTMPMAEQLTLQQRDELNAMAPGGDYTKLPPIQRIDLLRRYLVGTPGDCAADAHRRSLVTKYGTVEAAPPV